MMANKFLDEYVLPNIFRARILIEFVSVQQYLHQEDLVRGFWDLARQEMNRMEREFLIGIEFGLYVDKSTYESWLNLLKGLVWAKDMDSRRWRRTRGAPRASRLMHPSTAPRNSVRHTHRARSTLPVICKLATSLPDSAYVRSVWLQSLFPPHLPHSQASLVFWDRFKLDFTFPLGAIS